MTYNMDGYVDVAERIRQFKQAHPDGRLRGEGEFVRNAADEIIGYIYTAYAYTSPDDQLPAIGTAFEPIPGKTSFTRDSEVQNAETSAWGRAIVALGFETKHIASAEEVRNRTDQPFEPGVAPPADPPPPAAEPKQGRPPLAPHQKRAYAAYKKAEEAGKATKDSTLAEIKNLGASKWSDLSEGQATQLVAWLEDDLPF